jgi:hypothetical protein
MKKQFERDETAQQEMLIRTILEKGRVVTH